MRLIIRILVNAAALWIAALMIDGIDFASNTGGTEQFVVVLAVAVIFGLVNALIRPIVKVLTLPLTVLTLGLFTFVVNALMLLLTAWISGRLDLAFQVDGFLAALLGAVVISIVSFVLDLVLPERYER
jgi:putative membrane protein